MCSRNKVNREHNSRDFGQTLIIFNLCNTSLLISLVSCIAFLLLHRCNIVTAFTTDHASDSPRTSSVFFCNVLAVYLLKLWYFWICDILFSIWLKLDQTYTYQSLFGASLYTNLLSLTRSIPLHLLFARPKFTCVFTIYKVFLLSFHSECYCYLSILSDSI